MKKHLFFFLICIAIGIYFGQKSQWYNYNLPQVLISIMSFVLAITSGMIVALNKFFTD